MWYDNRESWVKLLCKHCNDPVIGTPFVYKEESFAALAVKQCTKFWIKTIYVIITTWQKIQVSPEIQIQENTNTSMNKSSSIASPDPFHHSCHWLFSNCHRSTALLAFGCWKNYTASTMASLLQK